MTHAMPPACLSAAWEAFLSELEAWAAAGKQADFWWRDDDAAAVTPALERLLALQQASSVPLTLAVVPEKLTPILANRLADAKAVTAAQHGFGHHNRAEAGEKKCEFPASRRLEDRLRDLREGRTMLRRLIAPERLRMMLVPPWNRMAPDMLPHLPALGFVAVSGFRLRQQYWAAKGLVHLNTHVDPVDWRSGDSAKGNAGALFAARDTLRMMRLGTAPIQPVGLLSHHLRHDDAGWAFLAAFLERIAEHPAARWVDLDTALALGHSADDVIPTS